MAPLSENGKSILLRALEIGSSLERKQFLDVACCDDAELRREVEDLLAHHNQASSFLESPPTEVVATASARQPALAELDLPPSADGRSLGRLGHYEIEEVVGAGGFGVVLKARDTKLDRIVAIKTLARARATSASARRRFVREAKAAAAVKHENVVSIHGVSEEGPTPYLVMEFVGGVSLEEKLQHTGSLEVRAILRIGMQIASGLAAAHRQGLVHRDVKPGNILLENGVERVKITDFGLARAANDAAITRSGEVAGTPQYMSPEQALGQPVDSRSDLFSLGSVLYALCTGRSPFRADSALAALRRVCDDTPRPIQDINPDTPAWLIVIIDRLLAKQPADRFQTASEVADLLNQHLAQWQQSTPLPRLTTSAPAKRTPASSRRAAWAIAALTLTALLLTIGLAEGTGITQVSATVIRLFTPEGTLVIETADPNVKVTVEGDGGLVIAGGGLRRLHLKPGSYRIKADKNGQPISLDQTLVEIERGGTRIVRVGLEAAAPRVVQTGPSKAPLSAAGDPPQAAERAFVIFDRNGAEGLACGSLAEAVEQAGYGDTIEIRGNGPYLTGPLKVTKSLKLRAGRGFRPVIQDSPVAGTPPSLIFLEVTAPFVCEGIELRGDTASLGPDLLVRSLGAPLYVTNCHFNRMELMAGRPRGVVRNSQIMTGRSTAVALSGPQSSFSVENNIIASHSELGAVFLSGIDTSAAVERNLIFGSGGILSVGCDAKHPRQQPLRLSLAQNILVGSDKGYVLRLNEAESGRPRDVPPGANELESLLRETVEWKENRNLYSAGGCWLALSYGRMGRRVEPSQPYDMLPAWNEFWGQSNTGSIAGSVAFHGGSSVGSAPETFQPPDFQLREHIADHKNDFGPELDLVGPGTAYERWKQTPDYQLWLKESGQDR